MSQTLVIEKLTNYLYNAILLLQEEQYTKEDILEEIGLTEGQQPTTKVVGMHLMPC